MRKIKVGVVGGAGYVGGEMIRLLLHHDHCDLTFVSSKSQVGKLVSDIHSDLTGWTDLSFSLHHDHNVEVIFLCMGHSKSQAFLDNNHFPEDSIIIDLSRDYRLKKDAGEFIYGLCELNKKEIINATKIANPGCFATCVQLGLLPLADAQELKTEVHVTAITGSTGAGQQPVPTTHNSWRNNNISIYKAFSHQHLDEIYQSITQLQPNYQNDINFIPMRGSFTRGIFASIYLDSDLDESAAIDLYQTYYKDAPFVHISKDPITVKHVVNTNNGLIYISKVGRKLRIESTIDNLLKGAAGQAMQNLNILMGWNESTGLRLKASAF